MTTSVRNFDEAAARELLRRCYCKLIELGLSSGASGNASLRSDAGMLITPTGIEANKLQAGEIVSMSLAGHLAEDQLLPSSEWHMHAAIYLDRPEVQAIVHCHSRYATILACARRPVPAIHYMIASTGGSEIPVATYATFGTNSLAESVVSSVRGRLACLMANHGQIALGNSLEQALTVARDVEEMSAIYWGSLAIGGGHCLSSGEMNEVKVAFAGYGQQVGV